MFWDKNSSRRIRSGSALFVWAGVLIVLTAIAIGDVGQIPLERAVTAAEVGTGGQADASAAEPIQSFKFDPNFGVRAALAMLGSMYQKNIVPTSNVDGVLAFRRLSNVTFTEALDAILGTDFKYEQEGQLIKVYTKEEYKKLKADKDRMVQRVFTLCYVNATEMQKLIRPALSSDAIVAASTAAKTDTEAGDGGDSLAMKDTIVVYDFPERIEQVAKMVEEVDVQPPAILIEVTIIEATLKDQTEFGIDWSTVGGEVITLGSTEGVATTGLASAVTGTAGLTAAVSIDDVTGLVRALESVTDVTVLANPKIFALNKQAGHILIGSEDGYLTTTQVSADGAIQQVEFLESGTRLKFRPYICRDGYIRMEINPEQSQGEVQVSGDFVLPSKTTTQVSTNIMVKDGKTIVIGGLFKEQTTQTYSQIPVLGDLPFVGSVFKQTNDVAIRTELIILITPHIIYDPEDTYADERAQDVERMTYGIRKSLSWISRARLIDDRYAKAVEYYTNGDFDAALSELNYVLSVRPSYLEAIRLKERIIAGIAPDEVEQIERIMLSLVEQEESIRWQRR